MSIAKTKKWTKGGIKALWDDSRKDSWVSYRMLGDFYVIPDEPSFFRGFQYKLYDLLQCPVCGASFNGSERGRLKFKCEIQWEDRGSRIIDLSKISRYFVPEASDFEWGPRTLQFRYVNRYTRKMREKLAMFHSHFQEDRDGAIAGAKRTGLLKEVTLDMTIKWNDRGRPSAVEYPELKEFSLDPIDKPGQYKYRFFEQKKCPVERDGECEYHRQGIMIRAKKARGKLSVTPIPDQPRRMKRVQQRKFSCDKEAIHHA